MYIVVTASDSGGGVNRLQGRANVTSSGYFLSCRRSIILRIDSIYSPCVYKHSFDAVCVTFVF